MASEADASTGSERSADHRTPPTLLYAIKQVELAVRAHMDTILRPHNITVLQYTALTVLRRRDGLTSAELARNSFVTAQTMGEMITALQKRGLLHRTVDPNNTRRLFTSLTDSAHALLTLVDSDIAGLEDRMVADLSGAERASLRGYLNSCRASLA